MCLALWGAVVVVGRDFIETERRQHVKPYQLQNTSAIKMKGGGELGGDFESSPYLSPFAAPV